MSDSGGRDGHRGNDDPRDVDDQRNRDDRPAGSRGDRPAGDRRSGPRTGGNRGDAPRGDRRPYGDRNRRDGSAPRSGQPRGDRPRYDDGPRRPSGNRGGSYSDRNRRDDRPATGDRPSGGRPNRDRPQRDGDRRPYGDRARRDDRPQGNRPRRDDRPGGERRPYGDRPRRDDRPQGDRPRRDDRPGGERRPYGDRPRRDDRPQGDRPRRDDRPGGDRRSYGDRSRRDDRPQGDRPRRDDRPYRERRDDRSGGDRPQRRSDRPYGDRPRRDDRGERRPYGDRPRRDDRPGGERRPYGDRQQRGERRPYGDRPRRDDRPGGDRRSGDRGERRPYRPRDAFRGGRPGAEPSRLEIPDDVLPSDLDPSVRAQLRSLPETIADKVARHMVMADRAFAEDPEKGYAYAAAARDIASRVAAVRAFCGLAAYRTGRWTEALSELRAARRMSGEETFLPLMADAERGLGRPERALDLARSPEAGKLDQEERIELRIVESGARRDLGQHEAAVVALQIPELKDAQRRPWTARLYYAYADALLDAGRDDDARLWFARSAEADRERETDAAERFAELEGTSPYDTDADDVEFLDAEIAEVPEDTAGSEEE